MEVKPHKQIVVKVDGNWRLGHSRFVRELDPKDKLGGSTTRNKRCTSTDAETRKDEAVRSNAAIANVNCTTSASLFCTYTYWQVAQRQ